jgi:hypothetical protein
VAIAAAISHSIVPCSFDDVQEKLLATDFFERVDVIDAGQVRPTLAQLLEYDAVIVWSYFLGGTFLDEADFGNVLADYVDAGGGVVVAMRTNAAPQQRQRLMGRWEANPDYEVIVGGQGEVTGWQSLGLVHDPGHPLMAGVDTFEGGDNSHRPVRLQDAIHPAATEIAQWDDGRVLVAVGRNPRRVDLGFHPVSSDCLAPGWDSESDGGRLMANALLFVSASDDCYPDCNDDGVLDFFDFLCFQNAFLAGDPWADCDGDGVLDFFDFLCFQNEFLAGCP